MKARAPSLAVHGKERVRGMSRGGYRDYDDYWNAYLRAHSKPVTRGFHYLATALGASFGVAAIVFRNPWLVLGAFAVGYPIAIGSHFLIQKNKPLVNRPFWGARSDLRMCWLSLTGGLAAEYARLGLTTEGEPLAPQEAETAAAPSPQSAIPNPQ